MPTNTGINDANKDSFFKVGALGRNGALSVTASTISLTQIDHAGKCVVLNRAAGVTVTLPAASGTGDEYIVVIGTTATSNSNKIQVANATDVMSGSLVLQQDTDAAGTLKLWSAGSTDDTMTFAGAATTGGILGGYIRCTDYAAGFWSCQGWTHSSGGSEATPFSAAVS